MQEIQVIDNESVKVALPRALDSFDFPTDIVLVNASYSPEEVQYFDFRGIKEASNVVKQGKKAILYGWLTMPEMYMRTDFRRLFGGHADKIRYVRLPPTIKDFLDAFIIPQYNNPAILFAAENKEDEIQRSILLHHLKYRPTEATENARKYFGLQGTGAEIEKMLRDKISRKTEASGRFFPGVFCDIEGTFLRDNMVNEDVKRELEQYAFQRPVNLWTGGDNRKMVRAVADVRFPVIRKQDYRGTEVETVIDDMTQEEFEMEYGIKARKFRQIK